MPKITIKELENENPDAFKVLMEIAKNFAQKSCRENPGIRSYGLEKVAEEILYMVEEGYLKIVHDGERIFLEKGEKDIMEEIG